MPKDNSKFLVLLLVLGLQASATTPGYKQHGERQHSAPGKFPRFWGSGYFDSLHVARIKIQYVSTEAESTGASRGGPKGSFHLLQKRQLSVDARETL